MSDSGVEKAMPHPGGGRLLKAIRDPALRQVLRYCLPALLVGLILRGAVMGSMPYAYIQFDSADYLMTTYQVLTKHQLVVHDKRAYLTPLLFLASFFLPFPALITIAGVQHFMGVIATLLVGGLVRLWFKYWKVAIIPITMLFAANPGVVWYEHTLLGETTYLLCTLLMVLVGTLMARWPGWQTFSWFTVSLLLVFGARLEAKAYVLFAVLLVVLVFWKQWRRVLMMLGILALVFVGSSFLSGDRESAYQTYATLIRLAPDHSKSEPNIDPLLIPLRDAVREQSPDYPADLVGLHKQVVRLIEDYELIEKEKGRRVDAARVVRNLCREAAAAAPLDALLLSWTKFHLAIDARCGYAFDQDALWPRQEYSATRKPWITNVLSKGLSGKQRSDAEMRAWIRSAYDPERIAWFERYHEAWNNALIYWRLADKPMKQERSVHDFYGGVPDRMHTMPGMPFVYIVALLGMLASMWRPARFGRVHLAWVATMLSGMYVISLVAVTNARFRFVYEPFVLIYIFLLFDCFVNFVETHAINRRVQIEAGN